MSVTAFAAKFVVNDVLENTLDDFMNPFQSMKKSKAVQRADSVGELYTQKSETQNASNTTLALQISEDKKRTYSPEPKARRQGFATKKMNTGYILGMANPIEK